jgi:hypothetical protein
VRVRLLGRDAVEKVHQRRKQMREKQRQRENEQRGTDHIDQADQQNNYHDGPCVTRGAAVQSQHF